MRTTESAVKSADVIERMRVACRIAREVLQETGAVGNDELRKLGEERAATRAAIPALEAELEGQKQRLAIISAQQEY